MDKPTERDFTELEKQARRRAEFRQLRRKHRREDFEANLLRHQKFREEMFQLKEEFEASIRTDGPNEMDECGLQLAKVLIAEREELIQKYQQLLEEEE
jgi:hypothetical protein